MLKYIYSFFYTEPAKSAEEEAEEFCKIIPDIQEKQINPPDFDNDIISETIPKIADSPIKIKPIRKHRKISCDRQINEIGEVNENKNVVYKNTKYIEHKFNNVYTKYDCPPPRKIRRLNNEYTNFDIKRN